MKPRDQRELALEFRQMAEAEQFRKEADGDSARPPSKP